MRRQRVSSRSQPFGAKASSGEKRDLVIHLLGAAHPIAQIDVRQAARPRRLHMIQDHVGAQAAGILAGMEEGIDHGKPVAQHDR